MAVYTNRDAQAITTGVEVGRGGEGVVYTVIERTGSVAKIYHPAQRSHAVTAARLGKPWGAALREWTDTKAGVTLGIGLGMSEPDDPTGSGFFRFGHMGHVNAHMILGLLGVVEAGMGALSIPHSPGGVEAAAREIAAAAG